MISIKKHHAKLIPSIMQKMKNTIKVSPKLISDDTFLEKRKRYFGTLIFPNISALARSEPIPPLVESEK